MVTDDCVRSGGDHTGVDATVPAGLLLTIVSLVWLVLTSIVVADLVISNVGAVWSGNLFTDPEGDARRGLFLAVVVLAIEVGTLVISVAVVLRRWWSRWVALAVSCGFAALTAYWLTEWPALLLFANLAILVSAAVLLTGTLISHRGEPVFLWGERATSAPISGAGRVRR